MKHKLQFSHQEPDENVDIYNVRIPWADDGVPGSFQTLVITACVHEDTVVSISLYMETESGLHPLGSFNTTKEPGLARFFYGAAKYLTIKTLVPLPCKPSS